MYYEEKVIDGVLCWRGSPNGEWIPITIEHLTDQYVQLRREMNILNRKYEDLQDRIYDCH